MVWSARCSSWNEESTILRILILAPHTDDAEFSCGGSINKWVNQGHKVRCVAFSSAEQTLIDNGFHPDTLKREIVCATGTLGLNKEDLTLLDYCVREFPGVRQMILDDMIMLRDEFRPDLVVLPSTSDTHQDHQVITQEGFRAFKRNSIIGYESPQNNLTFTTNMFNELSDDNLDRKIKALDCYNSQKGKPYVSEDFIRSLAKVRGMQGGFKYAESFEVLRWIWV